MITPICPHRLCLRPMLPTHRPGVFECPHVHRPRSVHFVDEPNYLSQFLPQEDDKQARPNHETKRSSAPWPTEPDRGPLVVYVKRTPKGRRGQRR